MNTTELLPSGLEQLKLHRIGIILERCAVLAKCIQELAANGPDEGADTFVCIELLAGQLGFHADLAREVVGQKASFGGAEEWMLPFAYFTSEHME